MKTTGKAITYAFLAVLALLYLFPIYTLVNTSVKPDEEIKFGPVLPARHISFSAYGKAADLIKKPFLNSVAITLLATASSAALGSITGYAFSKYRFKGSSPLFLLIVLGFYISPQSILIPLVIFMGKIGLFNSIFALILTHTAYGVPITTLLFRNFYSSVPDELVESSRIDGCGVGGTYLKIFLPLSMPGFAVVGIFQFTNIWNEFLFGLTLTRGVGSQPVTVAVANLKGTTVAVWNMICAGSVLSILPVVLIYIVMLKFIIKGLLLGSLKD